MKTSKPSPGLHRPHEAALVYHFRSQLCPACGYLFDAAANAIGEGSPKPGDYSLCLSCGTVLQYGDKGKMIIAPEPLELPLEHLVGVRKMQRFIRERGPLDPRSSET